MTREEFEKMLAAHYGVSVEELYHTITGQPIWLDNVGPKARAAHKKWDAFVAECADKIKAAASTTLNRI